jgi:peptidyl-prolyl cis-trans isomerase D
MAQGLLVRVQKGESLHELAREHSEGPSKGNGGYLGAFEETAMTPVFAKAVLSVDEEAVVPGLVETDFGYHVVRREKVLHLGHVLVAHREARNAHSGIQRSPQEAEKEAGRLRELLREGNRGEIAGKNSDCYRTKAIGGDLGYFGKGARGAKGGRLMPALIRAVAPLAPGELSGVVETEYGFHVLWRFAL